MTNMRYGYGAAGIAVIWITYFFSRMRLKLVVVLMLTPVLIFITASMMRMMLKIFSAGSCRLKRRCGSRVLGEVYSLPPLPPSHGPRSCHGSSPGGTAPRAVSALLGGQFVSTWVTVGQLCFLVVDGEKWFPAAAVMALHTTVGLGDFILMPEITMDNFVSNLKKRWVETTFLAFRFDSEGHSIPFIGANLTAAIIGGAWLTAKQDCHTRSVTVWLDEAGCDTVMAECKWQKKICLCRVPHCP